MVTANFIDCSSAYAYGLTQWDYGQWLQILGIENLKKAEVHFSLDGSCSAMIQVAQIEENGTILAKIPDKLLEFGKEIKAYIYVADEDSGETIRTIVMPVAKRPKPDDYASPGEKNLLRQVLDKLDKKADDMKLEDGILQLMSEKVPIGSRIRLPSGEGGGGREIELRNNGTAIQWRYTDSNEWKDLASIESLQGPPGETPEFEIREGHLYAIYKS